MHLGTFSVFTIAGSGIWNGAADRAGCPARASSTRWWSSTPAILNYAVYAALAVVVVWLVVRYIRRRKTADEPK